MARGAFWTIIVDDQPTAFRAPVREDLLPTLKQLQRQHPGATIKWFQRGRLWATPGDAMDASKPPRRGADWRPGGNHKDPREQYKVPRDVKRARWASQAAEGRGPWTKGNAERLARRSPEAKAGRTTNDAGRRAFGAQKPRGEGGWKPKGPGTGYRGTGSEGRAPRGDRPASGEGRATGRPKGDWRENAERWAERSTEAKAGRPRNAEGKPRSAGSEGRAPRGDRPAGNKPAYGAPKPRGEGGWKPKGERSNAERRTTNADQRPKPQGTGAGRERPREPRADWRGDRSTRPDATPRSGGDAKPKGRTWRAGELPPANRKRKKPEE